MAGRQARDGRKKGGGGGGTKAERRLRCRVAVEALAYLPQLLDGKVDHGDGGRCGADGPTKGEGKVAMGERRSSCFGLARLERTQERPPYHDTKSCSRNGRYTHGASDGRGGAG